MKRIPYYVALVAALFLVALPVSADPDRYDIMVNADGVRAWTAEYERTLSDGVGWTDGDRVAYRCAYGFLMDDGVVVGRVTFTRIQAASSYAAISDQYMLEGARHYDGTPAVLTGGPQLNECPAPSESYTSFSGDQRPIITFNTSGCEVLETRNYQNLEPGAGITFQQTESTDDRVTVVAYKNSLPFVVVYYDALSSTVMNSDL